jgi:murein peptide amidase A
MASITAMLSTLAAIVVIGHSVDGRAIELVHVPGDGPRVLVVGCVHGDECAGLAVVAALRRAHPREDLWLVPTLNPDGLARRTRGNAHGVDLNRSFPDGREP